MIKFFRTIRRKLLGENKFSRYLIYAFGEIFLVVVGILLALQFNNWNIESENSTKERWYLINIVEDIEYQKKALRDMIIDYEYSIETAKNLLRDYQELGSFTEIDSLNSKLNSLMTAVNFPNTNNTYQELVNSGQQTLISDKELSIEIIDFYLFCEDNYIDVKNNNDNVFYKEVHPALYSLHQTNLSELELTEAEDNLMKEDDLTNEYLKKKLKDPENVLRLLNALKTNIILDTSHLELTKETLEGGIDLIQKIDNYLGLTSEMVNNYD
jgi:hypothetical protein